MIGHSKPISISANINFYIMFINVLVSDGTGR